MFRTRSTRKHGRSRPSPQFEGGHRGTVSSAQCEIWSQSFDVVAKNKNLFSDVALTSHFDLWPPEADQFSTWWHLACGFKTISKLIPDQLLPILPLGVAHDSVAPEWNITRVHEWQWSSDWDTRRVFTSHNNNSTSSSKVYHQNNEITKTILVLFSLISHIASFLCLSCLLFGAASPN